MRSAVLLFPGSNREIDAVRALTRLTGSVPAVVWHAETDLPPVDLVVLPGGFAHGDYLRAGAMAARSPIVPALVRHAEQGRLVLGICNGFQVLTETGLLPGALIRNAGLRFVCRTVHLRVETAESPFTRRYRTGQVVRFPVAHHDGNYRADEATLAALEGEGRVAFRYVSSRGEATPEANPNGSLAGIAGILSAGRNVLGLMPHPEDAVEDAHGNLDGADLFRSVAESLIAA